MKLLVDVTPPNQIVDQTAASIGLSDMILVTPFVPFSTALLRRRSGTILRWARRGIFMHKLLSLVLAMTVGVAVAFAQQPVSPEVAKSVFHNLYRLAAAADQFYLANQRTEVTLTELLGPGKIIKSLPAVAGEDYSTIVLKKGIPIVLTLPSGEKIAADPLRSEGCTYAFHKVLRGDTMASIAASMHMSLQGLRALNPRIGIYQLQLGDAVRVK